MTRNPFFRLMYLLTALLGIGVWLTGDLGFAVRFGSQVFGRGGETWSTALGWVITIVSLGLMLILLYRNRS